MKIAGGENMNSNALYLFDKEMEETPDEVILAQEVTAENP
jgi:hypothetical protein